MARQGNNPKRRIAVANQFDDAQLAALADSLEYVGSAIHKRFPGDYGFQPPANPRPWKSLCDTGGPILLAQAKHLLKSGILKGMISTYFQCDVPKYIWSVDALGRAFEAKIGLGGYHGYMLESDDEMAELVLRAWVER